MSDVGSGRNYFYEGLFDAEEPQDAEQRRAFARDRKAQAEQIRVLREAISHYDKALKHAWPEGAMGESFHHWNEARKLLKSTQ